jgi:AcrR family transcriptional regulator
MVKRAQTRVVKQARAQRTRGEILQAAIELFARRGILATTMGELASAIKMTPGALYWHFPTKEDLLLAAIEELHSRFLNEFTQLITEGRKLTATQQLVGFFERTQSFLRYHKEHGIFFGMVSAEAAEKNDRVAVALRGVLSTYTSAVAGIVRYGQEKTREFRADVDPELVGHVALAAYVGVVVHQHLYRESLSYDPITTVLHTLMRDGVKARAESTPAPRASAPRARR